jgi:hypothetical protein
VASAATIYIFESNGVGRRPVCKHGPGTKAYGLLERINLLHDPPLSG